MAHAGNNDKRRATVRQVAARAAVSPTTVSLVFGGSTEVSADTAERVRAAAFELGYVPRQRRIGAIGVTTPFVTHNAYAELIQEVRLLALANGIMTLVGETAGEALIEQRLLEDFRQYGVQGTILISPRLSSNELSEIAQRQPLVTIHRVVGNTSNLQFGAVEVDNEGAAYEAAQYLIARNHVNIAYLAGALTSESEHQRRRGYQRALREAGLEELCVELGAVLTSGFPDYRSGFDQCQQVLGDNRRPDAILAFNDMVAIGAIAALSERGLRIPEEVSVIGFDDIRSSQFTIPTLTTLAVPRNRMAWLGISMLNNLTAGHGPLPPLGFHQKVTPRLVVRDSVRQKA
jgi:DNA-binding LacI/PurR family transcriptional regulator